MAGAAPGPSSGVGMRRTSRRRASGRAASSPPRASATPAAPRRARDFLRPHLRELKPYTPIEPFEVLSAKLGMAPADIVKLDANENPYGPPREVMAALGEMEFAHIYPDPETRKLRAALSEQVGVPMENILVGCGADELIDLLMRCVLDPGDAIVDSPPTFTMYAFDADVNGAKTVAVPRLEGFRLDVAGMIQAVEENGAKMVFVTSPNNPDGGLVSQADLERLLALDCLVVLDEAYIEFADVPSRAPEVLGRENLVVLRTFSKSAGLAGLRVGYGIFPDGLIEYLWRAKQPYNVSVAAEVAACAALGQPGYMEEVKGRLVEERGALFERLSSVGFLEPYPSQANFVLCKVVGRDAAQVKMDLQSRGVMVRHYDTPLLRGFVRVSVGTPQQTERLMGALEEC